MVESIHAAFQNPGLRAAINTLRTLAIRPNDFTRDPIAFAGFVQGYFAALDALTSLASQTPAQTIEPDFATATV